MADSKSLSKPRKPHKAVAACKELERHLMDARFRGRRLTMGGTDYFLVESGELAAMIALAANGRRR